MRKISTTIAIHLIFFLACISVFAQNGNKHPYGDVVYHGSIGGHYEFYCEEYGVIDLDISFKYTSRFMRIPNPLDLEGWAAYRVLHLVGDGIGTDEEGGIWRYKGTIVIPYVEDDNIFHVSDNQHLFGPNGEKLNLMFTNLYGSEDNYIGINVLCD